MKKEFYITISNGKVKKAEGDYDSKINGYYVKEANGWAIYDEFSGSLMVSGQPTKEECKKAMAKLMPQITKIRNSEGFLKGVINYREAVEDLR